MNITKNVHIEGKGLSDNVTKIMEYDVDGPNIILDESKSQTFIVKPWPQTLSPKPKTKGPWADTKLLQATTHPPPTTP